MEELTKEKTKEIIDEVLTEEKKKIDFSVNLVFTTKSDFFKNNIKNNKKPVLNRTIQSVLLSIPYIGGANNSKTNEIVIFDRGDKFSSYIINQSKKYNLPTELVSNYMDYYYLLLVTYHELRHSMQKSYDNMSFEGFFCNVDHYLSSFFDYNLEHDKYFYEIDANWYGINMVCNYFKSHYPEEYPKFSDVIKNEYNEYLYDYLTFNPSTRIENLLVKLKFLSPQNGKYFDKMKPLIDIFLDDKFNFKSLNEIISNEKFSKLDKRISYAFLSCQSFLKNVDFDSLSIDELSFLKDAISYSHNTSSYFNDLLYSDAFLKKIDKNSLIKLLRQVNKYVLFSHDSIVSERQNYMLEQYNDEVKDEAKKRKLSKGYISICLCYFLSIILSIGTILYIIIK